MGLGRRWRDPPSARPRLSALLEFVCIELDVDAERIVVHSVGDVREDGALELIELRDADGAGVAAPIIVD